MKIMNQLNSTLINYISSYLTLKEKLNLKLCNKKLNQQVDLQEDYHNWKLKRIEHLKLDGDIQIHDNDILINSYKKVNSMSIIMDMFINGVDFYNPPNALDLRRPDLKRKLGYESLHCEIQQRSPKKKKVDYLTVTDSIVIGNIED